MPEYGINKANYGTHRLIAEEIGFKKTVLDVGCNKGYLKELSKTNYFYGIDCDDENLTKACAVGYEQTFKLNLNEFSCFMTDRVFDVMVFGDILEHLLFPERVLQFFVANYLKDEGTVIISLPNIANISARINLLFGNFDYCESGILDKTHLHFYTLKTARVLIESCNLIVIKEKFSSNNFGKVIGIFPFLSTFLGYNLIFVCRKKY